MELSSYLGAMTPGEREAFAVRVGTTIGHLNNVAYRQRTASASLAMQIEICSDGKVTRAMLRPKDWHLIWPHDNHLVNVADGITGAGVANETSAPTAEAA